MLRLLAMLDPLPKGSKLSSDVFSGVVVNTPLWRSEVMYVSQSRVTRIGSPRDLFETATKFQSQISRSSRHSSLDDIASKINITSDMLDQQWSTLSGGQAQRALIAICLALNPRVLLLDEPTSALDIESARLVEETISSISDLTCVWVSHDPNQIARNQKARTFAFPQAIEDDDKSTAVDASEPLLKDSKKKRKTAAEKDNKERSVSQKYGLPAFFALMTLVILLWEFMEWPGYSQLMSSDSNSGVGGAKPIPVTLIAGSFIVLSGFSIAVSQVLSLDIETEVITSASRAILQLTLLGFLLAPIFRLDSPYLVSAFLLLSTFVSTFEATKRCKYAYPRMGLHVLLAIMSAVGSIGSGGLTALGEGLNAQYSIPMCGMLFGNAMTGCALALNTLMTELTEQARNAEVLLSLGATRWEAMKEQISRAISVGTTPTLQSMAVIGLVSIPGMMTGQILGGTVPEQAARYQMIITFYITLSSMICMIVVVVMAATSVLDSHHCLRLDLVKSRKKVNLEPRRHCKYQPFGCKFTGTPTEVSSHVKFCIDQHERLVWKHAEKLSQEMRQLDTAFEGLKQDDDEKSTQIGIEYWKHFVSLSELSRVFQDAFPGKEVDDILPEVDAGMHKLEELERRIAERESALPVLVKELASVTQEIEECRIESVYLALKREAEELLNDSKSDWKSYDKFGEMAIERLEKVKPNYFSNFC